MKEKTIKKDKTSSGRLKRGFFIIVGTIFLGLGAIGVLIPLLPTTPFLLLSAVCYYRGSERMHRWVLNNRWFGSYIKNYKEGKGFPLRTKAFIIALLWITIGYSALFVVDALIVQIVLFIVAVAVSIHIVTLPTFRKNRKIE